jgi:hypothetical protein
MMKGIWQGLVAGLMAGAVLAALSFVDYGSGNQLIRVASWLGLAGTGTARWMGFLLLLLLGGLFGTLFGVIQILLGGRTQLTLGRSLVEGLMAGLLFWVIIWFFSGTLINHQRLNLTEFLYSFVPLLLYGLLLGSIYFQRATGEENEHADDDSHVLR